MTNQAIFGAVFVILFTALLCWIVCNLSFVVKRVGGADALSPPFMTIVAIIFALFAAANVTDIASRANALRLSTQREANVARSIVKFTENVGTEGNKLRRGIYEYLDAATTLERNWLETGQGLAEPAQGAADALIQEATEFATHSNAAPSLKTLIINNVDQLRNARTERLTRFNEKGSAQHWSGLILLALLTQLAIGFAHSGKKWGSALALSLFTTAVLVAFAYLAFEDGLLTLGQTRPQLVLQPLEAVLNAMSYGGVGFGK